MEIGSEFPMKCFRYVFCLVLFFFLFLCCEKSTSPLVSGQVRLTAEEVGVTEVWLRVKTEYISGEFSLQLWRDDSCIFQSVLNRADTTVYDSTLLPAHGYRYRARVERSGHPVLESAPLEITTMDTTSHEFTWEVYTFGTGISSVLYDVAIIDENNIWAVGEIEASGGPYNAVHWDGEQWELKRINYSGSPWPIKSVFAFSSNEVWFDAFVRWNGTNFIQLPIPDILIGHGINKMWGTSNTDLYVVGSSGLIARYDGVQWQRIESGTTVDIQDIWGGKDDKTGESYILCPASDKYHTSDKKILNIKADNRITELLWPFSDRDPYSIWFKSKNEVYICGGGVIKRNLKGEYHIFKELPRIFMNRIRGNHINDIFVAGDFGIFAHYNGFDWWIHPNSFYGTFLSIDVKANIIVAVGEQNAGDKALIMVLTRY